MWVRSAAIRPVPSHAQLARETIEAVEEWLGDDERAAEQRLNEIHEQLESHQPVIAQKLGAACSKCEDEVAVALGYFLGLTIYQAFARAFGDLLQTVSALELAGVEEALTLDEELRGADPGETVDSDDVIAMEQPHLLAYIQEHIDTALEVHATEADVDAVHAIYRVLLVEVLALSYAVSPPKGFASSSREIYA